MSTKAVCPMPSKPNSSVTKQEEIAKLLSDGVPPAELVRQGYTRGTVYKISGLLCKGRTTPLSETRPEPTDVFPDLDPSLEADPEIVELRKAVRRAELEKQLGQIKERPEFLTRLINSEQHLEELFETVLLLQTEIDATPISGLQNRFQCGCGAQGLVAAKICCTECGNESSYGWFPEQPK